MSGVPRRTHRRCVGSTEHHQITSEWPLSLSIPFRSRIGTMRGGANRPCAGTGDRPPRPVWAARAGRAHGVLANFESSCDDAVQRLITSDEHRHRVATPLSTAPYRYPRTLSVLCPLCSPQDRSHGRGRAFEDRVRSPDEPQDRSAPPSSARGGGSAVLTADRLPGTRRRISHPQATSPGRGCHRSRGTLQTADEVP